MSSHERCYWNCGGTCCTAPKRPSIKDGPAINLGYYAGRYGGYIADQPKPLNLWQRIQQWLSKG